MKIFLFFFFLMPFGMAVAQSVPLDADAAVSEAMQANPEIRLAEQRLRLAASKSWTAGALDDPMLMVRDWNTPLRKPWDLNMAQPMFMLQRTFVSRDKRQMQRQVASGDARIATAALEALRQQVAAEVRESCATLLRNADERAVLGRQTNLLREASAGALAQYTVGKAPEADVLRAQMALTRLGERTIALEQESETVRARLNTLLGRSVDAPLEIAGIYRIFDRLPALDDLERMALEHRPELAEINESLAQKKDEKKLARMVFKPDYTVGLGYMLMPSGSMQRNAYMAEFSMNLPSLNRARHEGEIAQADLATRVTESEHEAQTAAIFREVREAQIATLASARRLRLYRDTLGPQAEAAYKAALAAYTNNRAEFPTLIDSQNLLLEIETASYEASAAVDASLAQLERAIGTTLPTEVGPDKKESTKKNERKMETTHDDQGK